MTQSKLLTKIKKTKTKLSVDQFMELALYDKELGFYSNCDDISKHFITAPELTAVFGETIAFWIINKTLDINNFNILELGAGNGTLALDILNTLKKLIPNKKVNYHILEISEKLKATQKQLLSPLCHPDLEPKSQMQNTKVSWIHSISQMCPNTPTLVIANEFFDALPAKQFQKINNKYYERLIDFSNQPKFILASTTSKLPEYNEEQVELYPSLQEYTTPLKKLNADMLFIDYGELGTNFTLQAVQNHQKVDIFHDIGNSDLTTQVDFRQIAKQFDNYNINISTMADFLIANGILIRAEKVMKKNKNHLNNLNKLLNPKQMGSLFKVLEISK